ncbi:hypothetical protein PCE1_004038 [Barthelona sp. PCE]
MENTEEFAYSFRVAIIGDSGVGKTSILSRYISESFDSKQISTIGLDLASKVVEVNDQKVRLMFTDTGGQERFRSVVTSLLRSVAIVCCVYDITDEKSFHEMEYWFDQIKNMYDHDEMPVTCVIGNKVDLPNRVITEDMGIELAKAQHALFFETSAKEDINIEVAILECVHKAQDKQSPKEKDQVLQFNEGRIRSGGCCGL